MSFYNFGFRKRSSAESKSHETNKCIQPHLSDHIESELGREKHDLVTESVEDLTNPEPKKGRLEVNMQYIPSNNIQLQGNVPVKVVLIKQESDRLLNPQIYIVNKSTARYFKKLYPQKMKEEAKKDNPLPVTALRSSTIAV